MVTMTESRPSVIGEMVEVRCRNLITIRGTEQPCNRLALRVTADMLALFPDNVVMTCDKCGEVLEWPV